MYLCLHFMCKIAIQKILQICCKRVVSLRRLTANGEGTFAWGKHAAAIENYRFERSDIPNQQPLLQS